MTSKHKKTENCCKGRKSVYLSGSMSSRTRKEYVEEFSLYERYLKEMGYKVVNPARFLTARWPWLYKLIGPRLVLRYDLVKMLNCDQVLMLPGWRQSRGARLEHSIANLWKMHITNNLSKLKK